MVRLLSVLLLFAPFVCIAKPCHEIKNDKDRLACYEQMGKCMKIEDDTSRLACLDGATNDSKPTGSKSTEEKPGSPGPDMEQDTVIPEAPTPSPDQDQDFGKPVKDTGGVDATITKVQHRGDGIDFITLSNGQIWCEVTDQTDYFTVGDDVSIRAGIFGSYNLSFSDRNGVIKVRRIH